MRRIILILVAAGLLSVSAEVIGPAGAATTKSPTGCVPKGGAYREAGSRRHRWVALTFDGGPTWGYTARILNRLKRDHVRATFFIRGQFIAGRTGLLRRELGAGHELANHSWSHPHLPGWRQLERTSHAIRNATAFTPCLFRSPYGDLNSALITRARHQRMLTIGWTVDSWDSLYENVSSQTIYSRVVNRVRPGAIILMHDGEGSHPGTLRALEPILAALRRKHLNPVTVSQLLGLRQLRHR